MHTGIYGATIGIHLGNRSRILSNKFCKNSWRSFRIYIAFDFIIETHLRKELGVEWIQKVFCVS